tara:strand:- start:1042 stop:1278 length:237 start_codon:yes stop_codon:yes gene_type:complete
MTIHEAIVNAVVIKNYSNYSQAMEDLDNQGVIHLGWLNSGIDIPKHLRCEKVYSNWSGSSCLYCDPIYRISYSVDMGD